MLTDKTYLVLATAASLVIIVVTTAADWWPWWVGVVICLLLTLGGLYLKTHLEKRLANRSAPQPTYQPPPPPMPPASIAVQGLVLPSAQRDYRFELKATVLWRPAGPQGMDHLAVDTIRERATMLTQRESPADTDLIAPRLAADLAVARWDRTGQLEVWAQETTLTIPPDDQERLNRLAKVRKDEEVWDHERAYERSKRAYLRDDVLSSTGSAVVWWLSQNTTQVRETVALIDTLARLVAAAQDREVEPHTPPPEDFVDRLMTELLPTSSEPERADLADRLATLATEAGATDLAQALRTRFNAPDFTTPNLFTPTETNPIPDPPSPVHPNGQTESAPPPHAP